VENLRPLRRRVALVTGGAHRIGAAIVVALARAGADIALHARSHAREADALARRLRSKGTRVHVFLADLADARACAALPHDVVSKMGRLDVLVNNAGLFEPTDPRSADAEAFDRLMGLNARAVWLVTSAAARMLEKTQGAVVNVACASAFSAWPSFIPYSASKAAVASLTQGFAKALAPRVRVNAVAPGPILPAKGSTTARNRAAVDATWLARWGTPKDIAEAVVFLAARAPFMTGVVLPVDGGRFLGAPPSPRRRRARRPRAR